MGDMDALTFAYVWLDETHRTARLWPSLATNLGVGVLRLEPILVRRAVSPAVRNSRRSFECKCLADTSEDVGQAVDALTADRFVVYPAATGSILAHSDGRCGRPAAMASWRQGVCHQPVVAAEPAAGRLPLGAAFQSLISLAREPAAYPGAGPWWPPHGPPAPVPVNEPPGERIHREATDMYHRMVSQEVSCAVADTLARSMAIYVRPLAPREGEHPWTVYVSQDLADEGSAAEEVSEDAGHGAASEGHKTGRRGYAALGGSLVMLVASTLGHITLLCSMAIGLVNQNTEDEILRLIKEEREINQVACARVLYGYEHPCSETVRSFAASASRSRDTVCAMLCEGMTERGGCNAEALTRFNIHHHAPCGVVDAALLMRSCTIWALRPTHGRNELPIDSGLKPATHFNATPDKFDTVRKLVRCNQSFCRVGRLMAAVLLKTWQMKIQGFLPNDGLEDVEGPCFALDKLWHTMVGRWFGLDSRSRFMNQRVLGWVSSVMPLAKPYLTFGYDLGSYSSTSRAEQVESALRWFHDAVKLVQSLGSCRRGLGRPLALPTTACNRDGPPLNTVPHLDAIAGHSGLCCVRKTGSCRRGLGRPLALPTTACNRDGPPLNTVPHLDAIAGHSGLCCVRKTGPPRVVNCDRGQYSFFVGQLEKSVKKFPLSVQQNKDSNPLPVCKHADIDIAHVNIFVQETVYRMFAHGTGEARRTLTGQRNMPTPGDAERADASTRHDNDSRRGQLDDGVALHLSFVPGLLARDQPSLPPTAGCVLNLMRSLQHFCDLSASPMVHSTPFVGKAALLLARQAYQRADRLGEEHPEALAATYHLAQALAGEGCHSEATKLFEYLQTVYNRKKGESHMDTLAVCSAWALSLCALGKHDDAATFQDSTLTKLRSKVGSGHPRSMTEANNLALTLTHLGRHDEALPLFREAFEYNERTTGSSSQEWITAANNLAGSLCQAGDLEEAAEVFLKAVGSGRRVLGERHPLSIKSASNLAVVLQRLGRLSQAAEEQAKLVSLLEETRGRDDAQTRCSALFGSRSRGEARVLLEFE
ncbi:KLC1 [Symbiodinium sp. CCMP2592]|nr:KLC1 [Symbiodinium sp. CCMP2592]